MTKTLSLFQIGDSAIIHGLDGESARFNATRCRILSHSMAMIGKHAEGGHPVFVDGYRCETADGEIFAIDEQNLCKDRGDMDQVVSWQDCGWMPAELRA
jgi:hypothetical protein